MTDSRKLFLKPIFRGKRFEDHSIPIEVLSDLRAYGSMVEELARHIFISSHSGRSRLPRGFKDSFKLRLTAVEPGSAIPIFERAYPTAPPVVPDEFDQARDIILEAIDALSNDRPVPSLFPLNLLGMFEGFGRSLEDDESIELCKPNTNSGPKYDRKVRLRLLSVNKGPTTGVCQISGMVSGFDAEKKVFNLILEDGKAITGPLDRSFDLSLRDSAHDYEYQDVAARLVGIAKFAPDGSIQSIEKLQHLTTFRNGVAHHYPDLAKRFAEISVLNDGWFDGKGTKFLEEFLAEVQVFLGQVLSKSELPAPFIYPSPDGPIEAEWSFGSWEISASISSDNAKLLFHATDISGEEIREDQFDWNSEEAADKAISFLSKFLARRI